MELNEAAKMLDDLHAQISLYMVQLHTWSKEEVMNLICSK